VILIAVFAVAAAYQLIAIVACVLRRGQGTGVRGRGAVSILKPIHGADPGLREAIASHMTLVGDFELLCGVSSLSDSAVPVLREFPQARVVVCDTRTPNGKVGVLMDLAREARHPILIVNDADICVPSDYIERVTSPLADPRVGLVTCLYRAQGSTFPARFEALGVATDFAPSTLVARLVGVDEFAMGSTLAFRRSDLDRIGGFTAIADYLADDYQIGHRIHSLGLKCVLSDLVVETRLGGGWRDVWNHQLRWARTIRVSKPIGYLGLPVTNATFWLVVEACFGRFELTLGLLTVRLVMAIVSGWGVIRSRDVLLLWFLVPLRDLFAMAIWFAGLFGRTVLWRGQRLRLDEHGRIVS